MVNKTETNQMIPDTWQIFHDRNTVFFQMADRPYTTKNDGDVSVT